MLTLSRGSSSLTRNVLKDMNKLIPAIKEGKYDTKNRLDDLRELMDLNDCVSTLYFETTKRRLSTWISHKDGPSIRFKTYNMFTMRDLSFPVNAFAECGHVLLFSKEFDTDDNLKIVKDLIKKVFIEGDVVDRAMCFHYFDNKIWMRVYGISGDELNEMGPRIVWEVDKIIEGCFSGKLIHKGEKEDKS
jgi:ribosome biogenesis protein BRX1